MGVRKMVGKKFFVAVTVMKDQGTVIATLSGQLRAKSRSDAEIEAGKYRDWLNEGKDIGPEWFIVEALNEAEVKTMPENDRWARGRMAPTQTQPREKMICREKKLDECSRCEGEGLIEKPSL